MTDYDCGMTRIPCPICRTKFDPATTVAMPFCSKRCQQIDLGRWLGESYGVPFQRQADLEDEEIGEGFRRTDRQEDDESYED